MINNKVEGAQEIDEFDSILDRRRIKKAKRDKQKEKENGEAKLIGPDLTKKPKMDMLEVVLENLPCSDLYERSLMHRENVTIVLASSKTNFIITISVDGHIKFWRKMFRLVDFAKHFRAHTGIVTCASLSENHDKMATVSPADKTVKIFDILNQDLLDMLKLQFQPYSCEFVEMEIFKHSQLFISDANSGDIFSIDDTKDEKDKIIRAIKIHQSPVRYMKYFSRFGIIITIDTTGRMEVWEPSTQDFPKTNKKLTYRTKLETDFYELVKLKLQCMGMAISSNQQYFAIYASDKKVRVFQTSTGKIILTLDESIEAATLKQTDQSHPENITLRIDPQDFERRLAIEKDIEKQPEQLKQISLAFDETDTVIVYPTFLGVKFVDINTGVLVRIVGKSEQMQRFMRVALYQGTAMKNTQNEHQSHNGSLNRKETDPTLYASSHKSNKFYAFSKRVPEEIGDKTLAMTRDVLNEPINQIQQSLNVNAENKAKTMSGQQAVIQTTYGEIYINLFPNEAPKTVENFVQHSKNGYYDCMIFHRVQQGFMIQTGCPKGNGTGGESIWGGEFQDEFHPELRHEKPFTVSMANAGTNTNASQFFITVCPAPWLDDKHTIYGRVYKGMDVVMQISEVETDDFDKPLNEIKIIKIKIM